MWSSLTKDVLQNIPPCQDVEFNSAVRNAQKQALEAGETESGCTVHYITKDLDDGPIILQRKVPVLSTDTVESLSNRILEQEHIAYSDAIQHLIDQQGD